METLYGVLLWPRCQLSERTQSNYKLGRIRPLAIDSNTYISSQPLTTRLGCMYVSLDASKRRITKYTLRLYIAFKASKEVCSRDPHWEYASVKKLLVIITIIRCWVSTERQKSLDTNTCTKTLTCHKFNFNNSIIFQTVDRRRRRYILDSWM